VRTNGRLPQMMVTIHSVREPGARPTGGCHGELHEATLRTLAEIAPVLSCWITAGLRQDLTVTRKVGRGADGWEPPKAARQSCGLEQGRLPGPSA
jgi:hypothetical protein